MFGRKTKTVPEHNEAGRLAANLRDGLESKSHGVGSRFDATMSGIVTSLIDKLVVPWFIKCIKRYSETDFHTRLSGWFCSTHNMVHPAYQSMWDEGCEPFTFIRDMHLNHKIEYAIILKNASILKRFYDFNVPLTHKAIMIELQRVGWTVQPHESMQILTELYQLRNMIMYGSYEVPSN